MSEFKQLSMFDDQPESEDAFADAPATAIGPALPFEDAVVIYLDALKLSGASHHTIKAFRSDLNLLGHWAGKDMPISEFSTNTLNQFLNWMLTERDKPCSPKTYARRVTTLKSFFGYLTEENAIEKDPAAPIVQRPVTSPLPDVLLDEEIDALLETALQLRRDADDPDARPYLLITLLLETGIKKAECMSLKPQDVIRTGPDAPYLWVRYASPRMRYKERKIPLELDWLAVLDEYMMQYQPDEMIFDCTARNLEYVLSDLAKMAGAAEDKISFETLRWTCAIRDYRTGMDEEKLRQKLGLSRVSWRKTSTRLAEMNAEYFEDAEKEPA